MRMIDSLLAKIEVALTLPEVLLNSFEKNQKKLPLTATQSEKLNFFLPLLSFPVIAIDNSVISILFLFFLLLLGPKKPLQAMLIEQSIFLSIGSLFPEYAPYVFIWMVASWILSTHTPQFGFAHPIHRFLAIIAVLIYKPFIFLIAPLLGMASVILAIHSKFFVWGKTS
ncbi:MAG: hypothetical protein ACOYK9_03055 [Chlamydiia bacterium]